MKLWDIIEKTNNPFSFPAGDVGLISCEDMKSSQLCEWRTQIGQEMGK